LNKPTVKRAVLVLLVLSACIACDQASKVAAESYLASSLPISVWDGRVRFHYILNTGVFLSLGADLPASLRFWLFTASVGVLLAGMLVLVLTSRKMGSADMIAISLIVGGGMSNLLDRLLRQGAVVDFLNIRFANLSTGIFNLADVQITIGTAVLLLSILHRKSMARKPASLLRKRH
jgi:signal peptidase II